MLLYEKPETPERFVRLCPTHGESLLGEMEVSARPGTCPERLRCPRGHSINPEMASFWVWDTQTEQRVAIVSRGTVRWEDWFFDAMRRLSGREDSGLLAGSEAPVDEPAPFMDERQIQREEARRRMERSRRYHERLAAALQRKLQAMGPGPESVH
jgi:hypothetical protein